MPEADIDLLLRAVSEASAVALQFSGPEAKRWEKNAGEGPVTEADIAVNDALEKHLRSARPDYGWLSEESPDSDARLSTGKLFIIDPIDGTRSFIDGSGTWAISVAVVEQGVSVAGVVALPARDLLYSATLGQGARLNGKPITASRRAALEGAEVLVPRPALNPDYWPGGVPEVSRHHRPSLAYRLCLAASGRFDAMLTLRDCWEWDIAAGALIASEAGCTVSDRNGGALVFNNRHPKNPGVLVANPIIHAALMSLLITAA